MLGMIHSGNKPPSTEWRDLRTEPGQLSPSLQIAYEQIHYTDLH
jgi:hypothetical protein